MIVHRAPLSYSTEYQSVLYSLHRTPVFYSTVYHSVLYTEPICLLQFCIPHSAVHWAPVLYSTVCHSALYTAFWHSYNDTVFQMFCTWIICHEYDAKFNLQQRSRWKQTFQYLCNFRSKQFLCSNVLLVWLTTWCVCTKTHGTWLYTPVIDQSCAI